MRKYLGTIILTLYLFSCSKKNEPAPQPQPEAIAVKSIFINNTLIDNSLYNNNTQPVIKVLFSGKVLPGSVASAISLTEVSGAVVPVNTTLQNNDSILIVQPSSSLKYLSKYIFQITTSLKSSSNGNLTAGTEKNFITQIDSTRKFPPLSDDSLLTLVQKQTSKYFWDFGHPVSGMARERNTSGDVVTTGGTGFGVMAIPVAINRNFITRAEGLARVQKIVNFLKNAAHFHGAFPHWMDGVTGGVIPFSANDDGADLVETSYLMMGLLTARQYFNGTDAAEATLRTDINTIWNNVEWDWFQQNGKKVLYWHWSPNSGWAINVPIQGWNECLITYTLAASSATHSITKAVYDSGFARNGAMVNNNSYYGYTLPLGESYGGPLFFSHYSFLGINPNGLSDAYAYYTTQTKNHTFINYNYCKANPKKYFGYSDSCWGLTASDIENGYTASSPTNDVSVIAPTAAISSIPYTPTESMKALKFFYYVLGDKLWGEYGFKDAFSLHNLWFANSYLAIDEGPIITMIENYRTGLLWNLFTSCPEIKSGLLSLGFSAPYL